MNQYKQVAAPQPQSLVFTLKDPCDLPDIFDLHQWAEDRGYRFIRAEELGQEYPFYGWQACVFEKRTARTVHTLMLGLEQVFIPFRAAGRLTVRGTQKRLMTQLIEGKCLDEFPPLLQGLAASQIGVYAHRHVLSPLDLRKSLLPYRLSDGDWPGVLKFAGGLQLHSDLEQVLRDIYLGMQDFGIKFRVSIETADSLTVTCVEDMGLATHLCIGMPVLQDVNAQRDLLPEILTMVARSMIVHHLFLMPGATQRSVAEQLFQTAAPTLHALSHARLIHEGGEDFSLQSIDNIMRVGSEDLCLPLESYPPSFRDWFFKIFGRDLLEASEDQSLATRLLRRVSDRYAPMLMAQLAQSEPEDDLN